MPLYYANKTIYIVKFELAIELIKLLFYSYNIVI